MKFLRSCEPLAASYELYYLSCGKR